MLRVQFPHAQDPEDTSVFHHEMTLKVNGQRNTILVERADESSSVRCYLNGVALNTTDGILEYQQYDKWLIIHDATLYNCTAFTMLVDMLSGEQRRVAQ